MVNKFTLEQSQIEGSWEGRLCCDVSICLLVLKIRICDLSLLAGLETPFSWPGVKYATI